MNSWKYICYLLTLFILHVYTQISTEGICSKLYVRFPSSSPVKPLDGVYTIEVANNSLYFRHSTGFAFLFYDTNANGEFINFGPKPTGSYNVYGVLKNSIFRWPDIIRNRTNEFPLSGLITKWYRYDPVLDQNIEQFGIDVMCIQYIYHSDFLPCQNGQVYFNDTVFIPGTLIKIADPASIYFQKIQGQYKNDRPVYRLMGVPEIKQHFLFFDGIRWLVNSELTSNGAILRCSFEDLLPEFTTCQWSLYYQNQTLHSYPRFLSLKCRGSEGPCQSSETCANETCSTPPSLTTCSSNGTCYNVTNNRHICDCAADFFGEQCNEEPKLCPSLTDKSTWPKYATTFFGLRRIVNDIVTFYCNSSTPYNGAKFVTAVCTDSSPPSWYVEDKCPEPIVITKTTTLTTTPFRLKPVTTTVSTTTSAPLDLDDYSWVRPLVLTFAIMLQIIPFFVACFILAWINASKETKVEKKVTDLYVELAKMKITHEASPTESRDEEKYLTEYNKKEEEATQASAEMEQIKQSERYSGNIGALFSLFCFVTYWLWLLYLIGCGVGGCLAHGEIFLDLVIFGAIMFPLCWIAVCIETFFSHEYKYLQNLGGVENAVSIIDKLKNAAPIFRVKAEAYHYETRTQHVSYTDANGNTQYRTETIQEKIVTAVRTEDFQYACYIDKSDDTLRGVHHAKVTKIRMEMLITFGDEETAEKYKEFYEKFKNDTENLDVYVDHSEEKFIPGYVKRVAAFLDKSSVPCWMNVPLYVVISLAGFSWCYRWAFKYNVAKTTYCIKKKIYYSRPVMS